MKSTYAQIAYKKYNKNLKDILIKSIMKFLKNYQKKEIKKYSL